MAGGIIFDKALNEIYIPAQPMSHPTKDYPGKPGPKPTGLKRTIPLMVMLNADECEHLTRLEKAIDLKKVQIIRDRVFRSGELARLRREQGANIK